MTEPKDLHKAREDKTEVMPVGPRVKVPDPTQLRSSPFGRAPENSKTHHDVRQPLDFSKNRTIGRFEMIREIARGGMGQVFLARDTKLGRKVAIKFLLHDNPDFVQRFLIEARATARCTHENIVTIFEVGEHDGLPYMVLEYLEGKTLSEVLEGKPSARQFTELMVPVVRALERAHEHGIVHRDLKPSNIFVTDRGQVKVLDFGVARLIDRTSLALDHAVNAADLRATTLDESGGSLTFNSNSLVGTLPYMSPEQWGAGEVDHLSDLWAVGIMFWRALTDLHPAGSTAADKLKTSLLDLDTPLPSIGGVNTAIPAELVAIVDRCLQKRRAQRFQDASELAAELQAFLAPHADRAATDACPYRGLAAFGENDAKLFFGRSNEIRTALAQLESWPLLAVIGPSGVGKSSFVHAGLVPAIRSTDASWQVRVLRPGRVPLHRLVAILDETLVTGEQPAEDLLLQLRDSPGVFGTLLRRTATRRNQRILVVVDQLEELFTLCDSDSIRAQFLAAILAAADDPSSPVRVVLSMRADFLDRLAGHKQFLAELTRGLFFLTAPDHENLRETLVRPAELAGHTFEDPQIVEDMLQAASSRGALPLLSFAATRLWDARNRERRTLTRSAYQQMGGVAGAFARHADQVAAAVAPQQQILLRAIMTRLVTPEGTRAVVDRAELLSLGEGVEPIIDHLVRARLIHTETDMDQVATIEIVHEMLITEWPTLRRWLEDSQALRGFMHELRQAAKQWDSHKRSHDLVWRGATAQEALSNQKRHVLDLSAIETAFLAAVRDGVTRARRRRVLVFATALIVPMAITAGAAFFTVQLSQAKDKATSNEAAWHRAAQEAESAKYTLQQKLDIIEEKEKARLKAEADAKQAQQLVVKADEDVRQSRDELEKKNEELHRALIDAKAEKDKAQAAAEVAREASDEAKQAKVSAEAAKAAAEAMATRERARADKLEQESKSIYNKDLRAKPATSQPPQ